LQQASFLALIRKVLLRREADTHTEDIPDFHWHDQCT